MLGQLAFLEQELFNELVFPLGDQTGRGEGRYAGFGELSRRFGIPIQTLTSLNVPSELQKLRDVRADLFISIRFGKILGTEALGLPSRGVLNLHSGLLPHYRGVLATLRALLNGDPEIGCTLHWIDSPAIDAGAIIETARVPVAKDHSLLWHILSLYRPGAGLILNAVRRLQRGEQVIGTPQDVSAGAYYSFPTDDDIVRFTALGWRLFDREDVGNLLECYGLGRQEVRLNGIGRRPRCGRRSRKPIKWLASHELYAAEGAAQLLAALSRSRVVGQWRDATSLDIWRRPRLPTSGNAAVNVRIVTGPTPLTLSGSSRRG